jgi:hypothetical protein
VPPGGGNATLVARGVYRPAASGQQVFQLHPNGYKFEAGHVAKLELLPNDLPYARISNLQAPVTVSNLELRLPVLDQPDGALVCDPAAKVLPAGYDLAPGFSPGGSAEVCNAADPGTGAGGGGGPSPTGMPGKGKASKKKCARVRKAKKHQRKRRACKRHHRKHKHRA